MKSKKALKMLLALAQETRLEIFRLLIQEDEDGVSAGMIAQILNVPTATLSFHLSHMVNAGLIRSNREGRSIRYSARYKSAKKLSEHLNENAYK